EDPYDYARAIRVFRETSNADLRFRVYAEQNHSGELSIDVTDRYGNRPVRLALNNSGMIMMNDGQKEKAVKAYTPGKWYDIHITVKATLKGGSYDAWINGQQ